jgi:hypothetical protein
MVAEWREEYAHYNVEGDDALADVVDRFEVLYLGDGWLVANFFSVEAVIVKIANTNAYQKPRNKHELRRIPRLVEHQYHRHYH